MEARIQYAKIEDSVDIAHITLSSERVLRALAELTDSKTRGLGLLRYYGEALPNL